MIKSLLFLPLVSKGYLPLLNKFTNSLNKGFSNSCEPHKSCSLQASCKGKDGKPMPSLSKHLFICPFPFGLWNTKN